MRDIQQKRVHAGALARLVAEGKKSVEEAREFYASTAMKAMKGEMDPYTKGLTFEAPNKPAGDPDKPAKKAE